MAARTGAAFFFCGVRTGAFQQDGRTRIMQMSEIEKTSGADGIRSRF
jgi:hypothetical protein